MYAKRGDIIYAEKDQDNKKIFKLSKANLFNFLFFGRMGLAFVVVVIFVRHLTLVRAVKGSFALFTCRVFLRVTVALATLVSGPSKVRGLKGGDQVGAS